MTEPIPTAEPPLATHPAGECFKRNAAARITQVSWSRIFEKWMKVGAVRNQQTYINIHQFSVRHFALNYPCQKCVE